VDSSSVIPTTGIARAPFCTLDSQKVYFSIRPKSNVQRISLWSMPLAGGPPRQELDLASFNGLMVSRDTKYALAFMNANLAYFLQIWDLSTHQMVKQLPWNVSNLQGMFPTFFPDGKAVVGTIFSQGSFALQYEPIDGSPTHLMTAPTHDAQTSLAWSPSGSKLGVLQLRASSDVVLITDLANKQAH